MNKFLAATAHELRQLATNYNTYIFLIIAWVTTALTTFYLGDFFALRQANLHTFFSFQPWIYLFFIPAITMGIWGQENTRNTAERLLTLPVSYLTYTLAKFTSLAILFEIMLLGTTPMVFTVAWLGDPAWGPIIVGYIGCWLIGVSMLAVAFLGGMIAKTQASGFTYGVGFLFVWIASGWTIFTQMLGAIFPQFMLDFLIKFSLLDKFYNFNQGLLDIRDVVFFVSTIFIFLGLTYVIFIIKHKPTFKPVYTILLPLFLVGIALNYLLLNTQVKWDSTPTNIHTISLQSANFIKEIDTDIKVKLWFSTSNSQVPISARQFSQDVYDLLVEIADLNPKIKLEKLNPEESIETEVKAVEAGITEILLPKRNSYYAGISFHSDNRDMKIAALNYTRQGFLEFDIVGALVELLKTRKQSIGIISELNIIMQENRPRFIQNLADSYNLIVIPKNQPKIPDNIDLIILFLNPFIDRLNLYAIDQYLAQGGKVITMLDPMLRTAPKILSNIDRNADPFTLDHPADLLRKWGLEYDYTQIVTDASLAMQVQTEAHGLSSYPMWLSLTSNEINQNLPFSAPIKNLLLAESGYFKANRNLPNTLNYQPILTTSSIAQIVDRDMFESTKPPQELALSSTGAKSQKDLSVLLTGKFPSTYQQIPTAVRNYYDDYTSKKTPALVKNPTANGALIAIADIDFLADAYAMRTENIMGEPIISPVNDNLYFFYNAVQYLLGDTVLLPLRSKATKRRTFTQIDLMLKSVVAKHQKIEQELAAEMFEVVQSLEQLKLQASQQMASAEIKLALFDFQKQELNIKKRLRKVRQNLQNDITALGRTLAILNMLASPVILLIFAFIFFRKRRKKAITKP